MFWVDTRVGEKHSSKAKETHSKRITSGFGDEKGDFKEKKNRRNKLGGQFATGGAQREKECGFCPKAIKKTTKKGENRKRGGGAMHQKQLQLPTNSRTRVKCQRKGIRNVGQIGRLIYKTGRRRPVRSGKKNENQK